ncbi:MAG: sugar phosphate isomerase/epimerase [Vicinamibacteria bacterium]|nr:sugar phosphate isomerase/epimerase [Vicinamibacteria bacterium]
MTSSRRQFLQTLTASAVVAPFATSLGAQTAPSLPVPGVIGLELYSVRQGMAKDVAATLKTVRGWGFTEVEGGVFQGTSAAKTRALLDRHGLRMQSMLTGYDALAKSVDGVIADAKTLGVTYVGTAWIPHQGPFGRAHVDKASADFAAWGQALRGAGLRFFYHVHGYEFQPGPDGTLMDTLITQSPANAVDFQADVFWVARGGGNPVQLLTKYPGRFKLMHLKDIEKGVATNDPTGSAPDETSVVLGTGQLDFPAILKAAKASGVTHYYIEDEHPDAVAQIPQTLEYLRGLRV